MSSEEFIRKCKELVHRYTLDHMDETDIKQKASFQIENVFVVWSTKVLQNNKALLSTTLPDGMYYEITYNGDKDEIYFDAYKKFENIKYEL
jgi:hypothetical protein